MMGGEEGVLRWKRRGEDKKQKATVGLPHVPPLFSSCKHFAFYLEYIKHTHSSCVEERRGVEVHYWRGKEGAGVDRGSMRDVKSSINPRAASASLRLSRTNTSG